MMVPSLVPSLHIKAGQQEMIAKLALHRSLGLSMGGFFSSSGNRENREMMMTFLPTECGGTMFSDVQGKTCLTRFESHHIFADALGDLGRAFRWIFEASVASTLRNVPAEHAQPEGRDH